MKFAVVFFAVLNVGFIVWLPGAYSAEPKSDPRLSIQTGKDGVTFRSGKQLIVTYVFRDPKIHRPYFTNLFTPGGLRVTRRHPPRKGSDSIDHATMHPGVWLAFGDLKKADFWRNKARVDHAGFVQNSRVAGGVASFVVRNRYVQNRTTICTETCRHTIHLTKHGFVLHTTVHFAAKARDSNSVTRRKWGSASA